MNRIAILNIGSELLRGRTVNTNAATMGEMLLAAGYGVDTTMVIHDDGPGIRKAVGQLWESHEVILVTGGLGPTKDDITKKTLLELFGGEMVCHEPTLRRIEAHLQRLGRPLLEHNRQQAHVPSSCEVMENENGSAPAMAFVRGAQSLIAMPGVPFEMKHLLRDRVLPWLKDRYPALQHHACVVRTAGIPESTIAEKMESIQGEIDPRVAIAYLPGFEGTKIELKLEGSPDQSSELSSVLAQAQSKVARLFAPYVYALEDKAPDRLLAEWLIKTGHTFGTAESCTGGEIAAKLVKHSGISAVLKGGIVAYWPSVKESVLGVRHETISESGIVSADVAREMAEGARRVLKCDYAISITGIAEAPADSAAEAMPQAYLGFAGSGGTTTAHLKLMKDRRVNIEVAAYAALVLALRNLPGGILGF